VDDGVGSNLVRNSRIGEREHFSVGRSKSGQNREGSQGGITDEGDIPEDENENEEVGVAVVRRIRNAVGCQESEVNRVF
jgi:hypothetical protein